MQINYAHFRKKTCLILSLVTAGLSHALPAADIPILTLTETDQDHLSWSWSDGTGSGVFVTQVHDYWNGLAIPLPAGISDSFYGRWAEDFPGHRNDVYLASFTAGQGTLYVTSDLVDFSPSLTPLGDSLSSYTGAYSIKYLDLGDHHATSVPDSGWGLGLLAVSVGVLARRRHLPMSSIETPVR